MLVAKVQVSSFQFVTEEELKSPINIFVITTGGLSYTACCSVLKVVFSNFWELYYSKSLYTEGTTCIFVNTFNIY